MIQFCMNGIRDPTPQVMAAECKMIEERVTRIVDDESQHDG